ncbi:MAG: helix-turn-helix transcriptional regulator [Bacteroidota bacterium]
MKHARHERGIQLFGSKLRKVRKEKGFTQEDLAYRADLELSQISRIERGVINTSISQLFFIAEALEISPKELFDFEI